MTDLPADAATYASVHQETLQDKLKVSVVVPTYRRPDLLERCLRALLEQDLAPDEYEIIVADDGPSQDTADLVARMTPAQGPRLHYLPVTATQGPAGARNAGWHAARADLIAFTDDDTQPDPGWLAAGLRAFAHAATPEGASQLGGTQLAAVTGQVVMPLPEVPTDYEVDASGLVRAEFVTANCFVATWALQAVGGFDERFTLAWREDSDLHFALLSRGFAIHKASDAIVVHPVRPAPPGISVRQQRKVVFDALLYRKWPRLYRERIRKTPPWHYFIIVASLLVLLAAVFTGRGWLALAAFAIWAGFTLRFCAMRLEKTSRKPAHIAEMFVTSLLIPPLAVFWRLVGAWRFRTPFI